MNAVKINCDVKILQSDNDATTALYIETMYRTKKTQINLIKERKTQA